MSKKLTPMMQQYMDIKKTTGDALVFFRLGDFYELFYEDAEIASQILDLVLTSRSSSDENPIPMCGVPHHAAKSYVQKLVSQGYKVAIVEQVEDPKEAKGLVKREVVEILTPGTYFEMDDNETRQLASLHQDLLYASLVTCDVMNGELKAYRLMNDPVEILKNLQQLQVQEIVIPSGTDQKFIQLVQENTNIYISNHDQKQEGSQVDDYAFNEALNRLLSYLDKNQKNVLKHLSELEIVNNDDYLQMDYTSMTNLELIDHEKKQELSLYHFMNHCQTSMGSRLLKEVLMRPLYHLEAIHLRHRQIELLMEDFLLRDRIKDELKKVYDIHRITARIITNKHNPQDFVRLNTSLKTFQSIQALLASKKDYQFISNINPLLELQKELERAFYEDAPIKFKEGRTFRPGISKELDELVDLADHGEEWLLSYELQEREKTGIKNLKIGYTRAFGYYIEISKGQIEYVRDDFNYIRKQTLTNSERYISEELQKFETMIHDAQDKILELEQVLFSKYTELVVQYAHDIHKLGEALAYLDVLFSLSIFSQNPNYTKPILNHSKNLRIEQGRHPVLESSLEAHQYIASSIEFNEDRQVLILTGPNMGGKSTYMRMLAINVILAQVGAYIPADAAEIGLVDQIFTRMGASDDILLGQSTFMVEMMESQLALERASQHSLILFDEIGRGTSTYDGMALAQAIIQYIHDHVRSRTVFSTHYHELVNLEDDYERIHNVHAKVHEKDRKITFLYEVVDGKATKSYGINVAKLADLPQLVIDLAEKNLQVLEAKDAKTSQKGKTEIQVVESRQSQILRSEIASLDINRLSPLEALIYLKELQRKVSIDDEQN